MRLCAALLLLSTAACFNAPGISSNPNGSSTGTFEGTSGGAHGATAASTTGSTGSTGSTSGGASSSTGSTGSTSGFPSPAVMLVVDRSGSMVNSISGAGQGCADSNGVYTGIRTQDCKWNLMLSQLLDGAGTQGFIGGLLQPLPVPSYVGLMTYSDAALSDTSTAAACSPGRVKVALQEHAAFTAGTSADIQTELLNAVPQGATPTAASLRALLASGAYASVPNANKFAVLLTDGAPNCDENLDATEAACGGDRCTLSPGGSCSEWSNCPCNGYPVGCLDDDATVNAIAALRAAGVRTFVVGLGSEVSGGAVRDTLNRMAMAGGVSDQFYPAQSQSQMQYSLNQIVDAIRAGSTYTND